MKPARTSHAMHDSEHGAPGELCLRICSNHMAEKYGELCLASHPSDSGSAGGGTFASLALADVLTREGSGPGKSRVIRGRYAAGPAKTLALLHTSDLAGSTPGAKALSPVSGLATASARDLGSGTTQACACSHVPGSCSVGPGCWHLCTRLGPCLGQHPSLLQF